MSDVIRLLPDSVANQIAAGEVIQRPASVVKELVENAVDAGATEIQVIIKDAGRTLIQVVDNGCGMSATDARLAFERHATSKIACADDLFSLHTMGFRGEALASICAVAQVDLRTQRRDDPVGTHLVINGSRVETQEPMACRPGSNMMVKNLFFNVPARRKFLKKDAVEMSNILHEFERLALVNPTVEMHLIHNEVYLHSLAPGSLKQRIVGLFGKSLESQLIPLETDTQLARISGFIVRPEHCKRRGYLQYLTVNGRNMRHPYFQKALAQCYEDLIPAECQPTYFIDFAVDPETIDVNIHPTKHEIKFEQEQAIRQLLYAAVKETLGKFDAAPTIDFETATEDDVPEMPAVHAPRNTMPPASADPTYNPFKPTAASSTPRQHTDWDALYRSFASEAQQAIDQAATLPDVEPTAPEAVEAPEQLIGVGQRYIAVPDSRGLRLIDVRRAHQAVLFEQFTAALASGALASQRLIFPEEYRPEPALLPQLDALAPQLEAAGFDLAQIGPDSWSINAVPAAVDSTNPVELLDSLLHALADDLTASAADTITERMAAALARAAAVRADRHFSEAEMQHLVGELMNLTTPGFTPTGHPTFVILTPDDIAKLL